MENFCPSFLNLNSVFYITALTRRIPSRLVKYIIAKWRNSKQTLYPNKESKRQITLYQCNQIPYALTNAMLIGIDRASKPQTISRLWVNTWKAKSSFEPDEEKPGRKKEKRSSKFSSRILESWGTRVFLPLSRNWIRVRVQGRRTPDIPPTKHFLPLFLPQNFLGSGYLVRKGQWVILLAMYFWVELPQYLQCQSAWPRA